MELINNSEHRIVYIDAHIMKGNNIDLNGNKIKSIDDIYYMHSSQYYYNSNGNIHDYCCKVYPLESIESYLSIVDGLVNHYNSFFEEEFDAYIKFPNSCDNNNTYLVQYSTGIKNVIKINERGEQFTNPVRNMWW